MTNDQREIEELLTRRIGLDPVSMGPHLIVGAARRRMAELGIVDLGDYAAHVLDSEAEQQALIEEVVVPESWFFRDEQPFRWLADHARERWIAAPWRSPLRALSVPCAGGQEPYSIAIALLDAGLRRGRFHIDAVDISARLLEVARRGIYSANALRGAEPGRWERHFRRCPEGYEIDPAVRSTVRFSRGNILDPALLADSPAYDVVFCRNLVIYLGAPARQGVLAALDRLLADDGVLFIGHADRLEAPGAPARFAPVGEPGCFAYRKAARASAPGSPWPELAMIPTLPMLPEPDPLLMLPLAGPAASPAPGSGPTAPPPADAPAPGPASPPPSPTLLEQAAELANRGRYDEAIAACERHIRLKGPGAAVYHLMGMIRQAAGDRRGAEECFHKTIYLDPGHDEALLALALLAERRGDRAAAAGFRRRAHRAGRPPSARPL
jgi:chemotaxis protein methyltransferase WspC